MSIFGTLLSVAVEDPVIAGSGAAFLASVPAALLGLAWLAVLLVFVGAILAGIDIAVRR